MEGVKNSSHEKPIWTRYEPGNEVVITGISGAFPKSNNVHEFRDNLFKKIDMVQENNRCEHAEIPRLGLLPALDKYDAGYFGVHERQAHSLDPQYRILQEKATEAIFDAGLHPSDLQETRTGVYVGIATCESAKPWLRCTLAQSYALTGFPFSMAAHRLSYALKLNGPSHTVETACSSSLCAIESAFKAIKLGEIDNAIVGATNLCLEPMWTLQLSSLGVLSKDGRCKSFDNAANGYVRGEAVVALFLQKSKDAKRIYAEVINAKSNNNGFSEKGIVFPFREGHELLYKTLYHECDVDRYSLAFLETHGTATPVGDREECAGIANIFTKNRKTPLLIGSVKSNCGHTEAASGLCGLTKCIIAMETNLIPPNLHYITPGRDIKAIHEGRLKVVTEATPLNEDKEVLMGVNSFGFGGTNGHVLLRRNSKKKVHGLPEDDLSRLVCVSGRTEEAVISILDEVSKNALDVEHIRLLHDVFRKNIQNHLYRGFTVVSKSSEISRSLQFCPQDCGPLYFACGELHNWLNIGNHLMALPVFAKSIKRIDEYTSPEKINISSILLNKKSYQDAIGIIGSIAVQVGIADILNVLELKATSSVGYSFGVVASAYYGGIINLEETVSCALVLADFINEVTLNGKKLEQRKEKKSALNGCKPEFENFKIALNKFKSAEKEVLQRKLAEALGKSKANAKSKDSLADAIINALVKDSFQHTEHLELNSLVLKIGDGLLRNDKTSILSFSNPKNPKENYLERFLKTVGSLYEYGYNPQVSKLYPPVNLPVSRGTRMISPYIKWNHSREFLVPRYDAEENLEGQRGTKKVIVQLSDDQWSYISGHMIDGRVLFPATGYLYLVWETYKTINESASEKRIVMENCKFFRATVVPADGSVTFNVGIQGDTGNFEIMEGQSLVVTGRIYVAENGEGINHYSSADISKPSSITLKTEDIYKEMRLRGYYYKAAFCSIQEYDQGKTEGYVRWDNNWITFLDSFLQLKLLTIDSRSLLLPTYISKLSIDTKSHLEWINAQRTDSGDLSALPISYEHAAGILRCGGVQMSGLTFTSISRKKPLATPIVQSYIFVPNFIDLDTERSVKVNVQVALENNWVRSFKAVEVIDMFTKKNAVPLMPIICSVFEEQPTVRIIAKTLSETPLDIGLDVQDKSLASEADCHLVIASNVLGRPQLLKNIFASLNKKGFVLSRESREYHLSSNPRTDIDIFTIHRTSTETLFLFQRRVHRKKVSYIKIDSNDFSWLRKLQDAIKKDVDKDIVLYSINDPNSGILAFLASLRKEEGSENLRCLFVVDETKEIDLKTYEEQLNKNMAFNILQNGQWGTYRYFSIDQSLLVDSEHCFVNATTKGNLSSLKWIEGPLRQDVKVPSESKLIEVHYAGINFKDLMLASGRISEDDESRMRQEGGLGLDFSGRDSSGNRVCGMVTQGALSSLILADSYTVFKMPDSWTMEEAATVPSVYITAIYSLLIRGELKKGETVLIHVGSGGVGQAAIQLALHYGFTVFTTVGSEAKRKFLKKTYPQLEDRHIGNSGDKSFEQMIQRETNGRGVDLVLNSLTGEKLTASMRCLGRGGRFIEIGKSDLANNNILRLALFQKEASFQSCMLDDLICQSPHIKKQVAELMNEGITSGVIKPLSRSVFKLNEVDEAFKFMAAGKHIGKVVIQVRKSEYEPSIQKFKGSSRYLCDPEKSYIVVGGLGGMGLEVADWLVLRGARKLVISSRRGITTGYQNYRIQLWRSYGSIVKICKADITTLNGCKELIEESIKLGPVDAVFNIALILKDALFQDQTLETFVEPLAPKALATDHLDQLTRHMCPDLRDFVVFSSRVTSQGNAGQTNYAMANSIMESICEKRRKDGYPAVAVQWGPIGEVGILTQMYEVYSELTVGGYIVQHIASCLEVLDVLLKQKEATLVSSAVIAKKREVNATASVVECVLTILGISDVKSVSPHSKLAELGLDSMTAVEITQTLEREYGIFFTLKEIRSMTLERLEKISKRLRETKRTSSEFEFGQFVKLIAEESEGRLPYIKMKSSVDENSGAPRLILFPGLEGFAKVMEPLASHLKAHAVCVQFKYEAEDSRIFNHAKLLLPIVEEQVEKEKPFCILAYSYGVSIALEVTHMLESKGFIGTVICIDGAPMLMVKATEMFNVEAKQTFENFLICNILSFYVSPDVISKQRETFLKCTSWEERVNLALNMVDHPDFKKDYHRAVWNGIHKRLIDGVGYRPTYTKLKSTVKLCKPNTGVTQGLPEDYGLSNLSEKPVDVNIFEGDHTTILANKELAKWINALVIEEK